MGGKIEKKWITSQNLGFDTSGEIVDNSFQYYQSSFGRSKKRLHYCNVTERPTNLFGLMNGPQTRTCTDVLLS
jgi:hypothetical protein